VTTIPQAHPLLSIPAVAERLAVSERTVRRLIAGGGLPALRIGGQIRVDANELKRWLAQRKTA
jgi:excisionase family DNA binding protein